MYKITLLFCEIQVLFYATLLPYSFKMNKKDTTIQINEDALLMEFLVKNLKDRNRDNIKSLLRNKQIWINNKAVSQFNFPLRKGQELIIRWARESDLPASDQLNIVFEDEHIIVIDKKSGLLSVSDGNDHVTAHALLTDWVKKQNQNSKVYIVHRLDQYTSGLLMFVKTEEIQNIFRNEWKAYITERKYTAVVEGEVKKSKGRISSYLLENEALVMISSQDSSKGKHAVTHYQTLKTTRNYSLLEVQLETGKKNQIRVHMQDIGHPVAGDRKYGAKTNPVRRLCLHATVLSLLHPVTQQNLRFESKVPADFMRLF
jgi:23S rRNA pseudouridine1911/1915/1917 synthase